MLFFQVVLLAGYIYAHLLSTRLSLRSQILTHLIVVWLPVGCLPVQHPTSAPADAHPYGWMFLSLATIVGALFFAISATAPLVQKWYSRIEATGSSDPYFLYALSNLGGLVGLISYALLVAPNIGLMEQSRILTILYYSFAALITICGVFLWFGNKQEVSAKVVSEKIDVVVKATSVDSIEIVNTAETATAVETATAGETLNVDDSVEVAIGSSDAVSHSSSSVDSLETSKVVYWLILSMIPASLVLGLTSYATSEISSIPLFWAVPLFLYLLSFIIAFGRLPHSIFKFFRFLAPFSVAFVVILLTSPTLATAVYGDAVVEFVGLSMHLAALMLVCTACHSLIAMDRPSSKHLTTYYLVISIGGAIGSCFNTFAAPLIFKGGEEYPIVLIAAGIVLSGLPSGGLPIFASVANRLRGWGSGAPWRTDVMNFVVPTTVFVVASILWSWHDAGFHPDRAINAGGKALLMETIVELSVRYAVPFLLCVILSRTVLQYRLGLLVISGFLLYSYALANPAIIFKDRNFFGFVSVRQNTDFNCSEIWNGLSLHGMESLDPAERGKPLLYMAQTGPVGQIVSSIFSESSSSVPQDTNVIEDRKNNSVREKKTQRGRIGVIGVGCGTAAYLAKPGQTVVFYEINPQVIEIANNPFYFSYFYLARQRKVNLKLVAGDGRLQIQKAPYNYFKLIISDAYSGSAIPTHLITLEAIRTYMQKLTGDGVLVFNINNEHYDLWPVFAAAAKQLDLEPLLVREYYMSDENTYTDWVVLTKNVEVIKLLENKVEKRPAPDPKFRVWTDDFANPLSLFNPDNIF